MLSESGGLVWPKNVSWEEALTQFPQEHLDGMEAVMGAHGESHVHRSGWPSFIWNGPCNYLWGE